MKREERRNVWEFKSGDRPYWQLRFFDDDGKLRSESTGTTDEQRAKIIRSDCEVDLNYGRYRATDGRPWEEFVNARLTHLPRRVSRPSATALKAIQRHRALRRREGQWQIEGLRLRRRSMQKLGWQGNSRRLGRAARSAAELWQPLGDQRAGSGPTANDAALPHQDDDGVLGGR